MEQFKEYRSCQRLCYNCKRQCHGAQGTVFADDGHRICKKCELPIKGTKCSICLKELQVVVHQDNTETQRTKESDDAHEKLNHQGKAEHQDHTETQTIKESNNGHQGKHEYKEEAEDAKQKDEKPRKILLRKYDHKMQQALPVHLYKLKTNPKGIPNLGNTCYMNAVLQVLVWTPLLHQKLTNQFRKYQKKFADGTSNLLELCQFVHGSEQNNSVVSRCIPENILNSARRMNSTFNGHRQQDSFEMFNTLIGGIEDEAKNAINPKQIWGIERIMNEMPVSRLFGGMYLAIFYYETCQHIEVEFQRFTSICVPVSNTKPLDQSRIPIPLRSIAARSIADRPKKRGKKQKCSIERGLSELTKIEKWEENIISCRNENCPVGKKQSMRRMFIYDFPPVLVLQINRFQQTMYGGLEKIQTTVDYGHLLDLTPFCHCSVKTKNRKVLYSLYGVVYHSGSISGGHYMAYVKTTDRYEEQLRKLSTEKWKDPDLIKEQLVERLEKLQLEKDVTQNLRGGSTKSPDKGSWYYVSDSCCNKVSQDDVINVPGAYILMYEQIQ